MEVLVGTVMVLLGAASATAVSRTIEESRRLRWLPLALAPPGALIGAGAAVVRGWDLWGSLVTGAVVVPLAGMGALVVRRRRSRGRS